jgi:hypothetical protein
MYCVTALGGLIDVTSGYDDDDEHAHVAALFVFINA